jgi:hypothetical protein
MNTVFTAEQQYRAHLCGAHCFVSFNKTQSLSSSHNLNTVYYTLVPSAQGCSFKFYSCSSDWLEQTFVLISAANTLVGILGENGSLVFWANWASGYFWVSVFN